MKLKAFAVGVLTVLFSSAVHGDDKATNKAVDCSSAVTTVDISMCAQQRRSNLEKALDLLIQNALSVSGEHATRAIKDSQTVWLQFRRTQCRWIARQYEHGTLEAPTEVDCEANATEDRIEDLLSDTQTVLAYFRRSTDANFTPDTPALRAAEESLSGTTGLIMSRAEPEFAKGLAESARAWSAYRDATCGSFEGARAAKLRSACVERLTVLRVARLRALLN